MELTGREKIIIRAATSKIKNVVKAAGDDFAKLSVDLDKAEKNLESVFGDRTPAVMNAIIESINDQEALADITESGLLNADVIQAAISEAMSAELANRL